MVQSTTTVQRIRQAVMDLDGHSVPVDYCVQGTTADELLNRAAENPYLSDYAVVTERPLYEQYGSFRRKADETLYMSLLIRPHTTLDKINYYQLLAAIAAHHVIADAAQLSPGRLLKGAVFPKILWPGQVMAGKKHLGYLSAEFLLNENGSTVTADAPTVTALPVGTACRPATAETVMRPVLDPRAEKAERKRLKRESKSADRQFARATKLRQEREAQFSRRELTGLRRNADFRQRYTGELRYRACAVAPLRITQMTEEDAAAIKLPYIVIRVAIHLDPLYFPSRLSDLTNCTFFDEVTDRKERTIRAFLKKFYEMYLKPEDAEKHLREYHQHPLIERDAPLVLRERKKKRTVHLDSVTADGKLLVVDGDTLTRVFLPRTVHRK